MDWVIGFVTTGKTDPIATEVGVSAWREPEAGRSNIVGGAWGMEAGSSPVNVRISLPERSVLAIYAKRLPYCQLAFMSILVQQSNDQC